MNCKLGSLESRGVLRQLRKAAFRKRRGLPSRDMSLEAAFDQVNLCIAAHEGKAVNPDLVAKLQWRLLRERLLERKQMQRAAARMRARRKVSNTTIKPWRRRQEWLGEAQAADHE